MLGPYLEHSDTERYSRPLCGQKNIRARNAVSVCLSILAFLAFQPNKLSGAPIMERALEEDRIAAAIVDAGFHVHKALGAGLLESAYEECLAYELTDRGLGVRRQVAMPIVYKAVKLDAGYRLDLIVESKVIVEIKAIEQVQPIHQAQPMTYLRLSGCRLGFLANFNVTMFKDGMRRIVV
jgi:GxxExxY protein